MAGPLTPDFYRYEWHSLSSVRLDGEFVVVEWADGAELRCFRWWLAEQRDYEISSREGLLEPRDLGDHMRVEDAWIESDGALAVRWAHDGAVSRHHPGWLRHIADGQYRPESFLPPPIPWDSSILPAPVGYHGPTVLADPETFRLWLNDLVAYGLTRLTSLSVDLNQVEGLARRVGVLRDSNFGPVWGIEAVPDPTSTAYMSIGLGPHTDFPSLETPPGFQFFHCIENSCVGGASQMTDGLAVALHLEQHDPEAYEALTTLRWVFHGRGAEVDFRWSGPLIDLGVPGSPPHPADLLSRADLPRHGYRRHPPGLSGGAKTGPTGPRPPLPDHLQDGARRAGGVRQPAGAARPGAVRPPPPAAACSGGAT